MSLTDDWKAGKLPFGEYWCKVTDSPYIEKIMSDCMTEDDIIEILAPVPSYEEVQRLKEDAVKAAENALDTFNENTKIRTLLKECKKEFNDISTMACYPITHFTHPAQFDMLFNKCREMIDSINAAIGESEE